MKQNPVICDASGTRVDSLVEAKEIEWICSGCSASWEREQYMSLY